MPDYPSRARQLQQPSITMRIAALSSVVLVITTSLVSAAPAREETTGRVSYSATGDPSAAGAAGWVELASATPASHRREFIVVGADTGALTHLKLTAASGHPAIQAIRVDYVRGGHKTFPVGKTLAGNAAAVVDLSGPREIDQIVVITRAGSAGTYVLEGRVGTTGVAMR
jgi:hypothetical protein